MNTLKNLITESFLINIAVYYEKIKLEGESLEFKHKPVLLDECIEGLNIKPNGIYVDGTLRRSRS